MKDMSDILKIYHEFGKKQDEIIERLRETKEDFTKDDLQNAISEDIEAKKLLQEIKLITNR